MAEELDILVVELRVSSSPHAVSRSACMLFSSILVMFAIAGWFACPSFCFASQHCQKAFSLGFAVTQLVAPMLFIWHPSLPKGCYHFSIVLVCLSCLAGGMLFGGMDQVVEAKDLRFAFEVIWPLPTLGFLLLLSWLTHGGNDAWLDFHQKNHMENELRKNGIFVRLFRRRNNRMLLIPFNLIVLQVVISVSVPFEVFSHFHVSSTTYNCIISCIAAVYTSIFVLGLMAAGQLKPGVKETVMKVVLELCGSDDNIDGYQALLA